MRYTVSVVFEKKGLMKYISHLDLLRLMGRALRRADLPFEASKGFSSHPQIIFKRALKLGVQSNDEQVTFYLTRGLPNDEFKARLQAHLPEGIFLKSTNCHELP